MKLTVVLSLLCLCPSHAFAGQAPPADPVAENLFPPELVMQHQSDIKLTEDQRNALMDEIQKAQSRLIELQQRLQKEVEALSALLKQNKVDEKGALAQLDRVLNEEREIKRTHLALVLGIRNKLTNEQEVKLQEIKSKIATGQIPSAEAVQRVLEGKMKNVQEGAQRWQNEGRDPSKVAEIMQEFEPLMKEGRHKEAEAVLDRALKLLREPDKDKK
jgi:Spy/CpxP family protein refolding chaperone